jgi:DNA-binding beta-propeller fold protein YncE
VDTTANIGARRRELEERALDLRGLGNNRVQKFDGNGTFLTKWGSAGSGYGQFQYPIALATDASGNVYVADQNSDRIQKFACP